MAGKKTTTVTNVVRMNATDAKRFMRTCGQPVSENDKLHVMQYAVYGVDADNFLHNISGEYNRFALVPTEVTVEQAATAYTPSDARELALLVRLVEAGIASGDDIARYNVLLDKQSGCTTNASYLANDAEGHSVYETDEIGKLLTTLTLS